MTLNSSPKKIKAALYARCSTTDQHPEAQIEQLRQIAEQRGWDVAGEYVDHAVSGGRDRRPELDRLMADVRRGRVSLVGVARFDRFARSVRHLVIALDEFSGRGVDFVSLGDGIDTSTSVGRFTFHVVAAVAELERDMIRERTKLGIAAARRRGSRIGRPPVRVDVAQARALQAGGWSIRRIAVELGVGGSTVHRALATAVPEPSASAIIEAAEITAAV